MSDLKPFPPKYERVIELVPGTHGRTLAVTGSKRDIGAEARGSAWDLGHVLAVYAAGIGAGCCSVDGARTGATLGAITTTHREGELVEQATLNLPATSERALAPLLNMVDALAWMEGTLERFTLVEEPADGHALARVETLAPEPLDVARLPFEAEVPRDRYLKDVAILVHLGAQDETGRARQAIEVAARAWAALALGGAFSGGHRAPFSGAELLGVGDPYPDEVVVRLLSYHGGPDGWHALLRALACIHREGLAIESVTVD